MQFLATVTLLVGLASALRLEVAPDGGNKSSSLQYGILYEVSIPRRLSSVKAQVNLANSLVSRTSTTLAMADSMAR
jgi:hypothetical protein